MNYGSNSYDLILKLGGIKLYDGAVPVLHDFLDQKNLEKLNKIETVDALVKIANVIRICKPASVFVNTGTPEDIAYVRELAFKNREESKLKMENHTVHFDLREEQGRIVDRTFYVASDDEKISSLANEMPRKDVLAELETKMKGIMEDKTMIIGFYVRGPVGSHCSNPAIEISSSAYVHHSADILYRNRFSDFDNEVKRAGYFYTNIHSEGENRLEDLPNARVFMDRTYQTTFSLLCTYAGNTLLMKKGNHRFSVDKAVYQARGEELSEHMFVTGIKGDNGKTTWFAGAAPSGCGKTTTAMAGHTFLGDDLAQIWIDKDGSIRSINPEVGIFGIVEDVNWDGDPLLMKCLREPGTEVIWSNVLVDNMLVPHWEGNGEEPPNRGVNFQGEWYKEQVGANGKPVPMSHPNSRCTISARALPNCSSELENPDGVETRVFTYSGRDSDTMPPVWAAINVDHGVVIGASIVSAATATEIGATGVKRAPWANAPFIPGALGDYMDAQFKFFSNPRIAESKKPILAGLNFFLTDEARGGSSKKLLGEKKDVRVWLSWLERRVHGNVDAISTPIGYIPKYNDLKALFKEIIDKEYTEDLYTKQFSIYADKIIHRIDLQIGAYKKESDVPETLFSVYEDQKKGLESLKARFGSIVTPNQLVLMLN